MKRFKKSNLCSWVSTFVITTSIIFSSACRQNPPASQLAIGKFKYSAFYWSYNETTNSSDFYLDHYIEIDKEGNYKSMRREEWKGKAKYFNGRFTDTLLQLIDSTLLKKDYNTNYTFDIDHPAIYDGLTYCFDFTNESKKIFFIPPYSPHQFQILGRLLDIAIEAAKISSKDTLLLGDYQTILAELDFPNLLPPPTVPPPPHKSQIKFKPRK